MLTFITLSASQTRTLPKVSYIKASEIWSIACILFIFASLVEFAFVNLLWRRKRHLEIGKVKILLIILNVLTFFYHLKVSTTNILKKTLTPIIHRKNYKSSSPGEMRKSFSDTNIDKDEKDSTPDALKFTRKFEPRLSLTVFDNVCKFLMYELHLIFKSFSSQALTKYLW